jgi:hypothetical protein
MEDISIIITDQPLGATGYGTLAVSPEVAFLGIVFVGIICSYVGYKALIWTLEALLPFRS